MGLVGCISHTFFQRHSRLQLYAGTWLLKYSGKNMMLLTLRPSGGELVGALIQPKHFDEDWNGDFTGISLPIITLPARAKASGKVAKLTTGPKSDQDISAMALSDRDHLVVNFFRGVVPGWKFERVSPSEKVVIDTDWPDN